MTTQEILQGVHDWTNGKIVYDISVAHPDGQGNPTPYADLKAALGTGGENIPEGLRKGGMSVKFIQGTAQGSDNKYIQARCMAQNFTTDVTQWQIENVIAAMAESDNEIINGIAKENSILFVQGSNKKLVTIDMVQGETYTFGITLSAALANDLHIYIKDKDNNELKYAVLRAGGTTKTTTYKPTVNYDEAYLCYSYAQSTSGVTISASVSSIGMVSRMKTVEQELNEHVNKPVIVYVKKRVATINDLADTTGLVNGDLVNVDNSFVKITDVSLLPSGGYQYDSSVKKKDVIYLIDGSCYALNNGGNVVKSEYQIEEIAESTNLYNASAMTAGTFIRKNGTSGYDPNYGVTDYIPVSNGDVLLGWWTKTNEVNYFYKPSMRFVCAYNNLKQPLSNYGAENVTTYTVSSSDIAYVRITFFQTDLARTGFRINKTTEKPYEDYFYGLAPKWGMETKQRLDGIFTEPYKNLPKDIVSNLAYKRLGGPLEHGYIILSCDDGRSELANYTVPMVISKNVPCSFCIMADSGVMDGGTMQATVLDAVNNHNCEIAQHGANRWGDGFQEWELRDFFARQKAFWDSIGVTVKAAAVPEHNTSDIVKALTGGLFGVCRCGYDSGTKHYDYYCNGPKSNLYALASWNVMDTSLDNHKAAIDYAIAHHYIYILYWHDNDLTAEQKTKLEAVIDYAKTTDIVFAKLSDIPDLV